MYYIYNAQTIFSIIEHLSVVFLDLTKDAAFVHTS